MLDLIIKKARTINDDHFELGIKEGKITKLAETISEPSKEELTLKDYQYLSPGWIDDHVHCFEKMNLYYDYPDEIGVATGVCTVIDAGSTGAENIGEFYELAKKAKTNVYALANISKFGIVEQDELADLSKVQTALIRQTLTKYPDFVVGIKARMSKTVVGDNGLQPLLLAKKIQKENQKLPLMAHIGSNPPELVDILAQLTKGDVLTHCFNGKANGIFNQSTQEIKQFVFEAKRQGVIFDIGHGTDSFNFEVAEAAFKAGLKADTISTDIYIRNRINGPVYDLATTMEKLRVVGYNWPEIIEKVTVKPAQNFGLSQKGQLALNFDADLTIFEIHKGQKELVDSNGLTRLAKEIIKPVKTVIGGQVYDN